MARSPTIKAAAVILTLLFVLPAGAQQYKVLPNWKYRPVNEEFWETFENRLKVDQIESAAEFLRDRKKKAKGLEKTETELAEGVLLLESGQSVLAYHRLLNVLESAPGSMPALKAWTLVDRLTQEQNFDLKQAQHLANVGNFTEAPAEILNFLDYLVIAENAGTDGQRKWSRNAQARLQPESYWGVWYGIQRFLQTLAPNPTEAALKENLQNWREWMKKTEIFPVLHEKMRLQEARFLQSLKQPAPALEIYKSLKPTGRELGRQMFERAWVLYNLKDYSTSLGLLQTLKTSNMRMAIEPEVYILAMVAYRDLCHYPAVALMRKQYMTVFGPTLEQIKSGTPLDEISLLAHLVAQADPWSNQANEITQLKVQRAALDEAKKYFTTAQMGALKKESQGLEKILTERLRLDSAPELQHQAERLIALTEQTKLLEYLSDLQEFQLNVDNDERSYRAEKASATGTDGLFWDVDGETWRDEFGTYKVLVSDRCPVKKEHK